jgi:hypothetical protein
MTVNAVGLARNPNFVTADRQERLSELRFFAELEREQSALALSGFHPPLDQEHPFRPALFAEAGAKQRKRVLLGPRSLKRIGRLRPSISALCSAARNARASRHPSAAAIRPYGTAALRGPAATDPDTPARSAAGDRRSAAAPRRLGITRAGLSRAAALRTHQPLAPIEHERFGAVPSSHLGGVRLDLMAASLVPDYQLVWAA